MKTKKFYVQCCLGKKLYKIGPIFFASKKTLYLFSIFLVNIEINVG